MPAGYVIAQLKVTNQKTTKST